MEVHNMSRRKLEIDEQSLIQDIISKRQLIIDGLSCATYIDQWLETEPGQKHVAIIRSFHNTFKKKLEQANLLTDFYTAMLGQTPRHVPGMHHSDSIRPTYGVIHFQTPEQIKKPIIKSPEEKQIESLAKINTLLFNCAIKEFLLKTIHHLNTASDDYLVYLKKCAPEHCLAPPLVQDNIKTPEISESEKVIMPEILTPPKLRRTNQRILSHHGPGIFMHNPSKYKRKKTPSLHPSFKS